MHGIRKGHPATKIISMQILEQYNMFEKSVELFNTCQHGSLRDDDDKVGAYLHMLSHAVMSLDRNLLRQHFMVGCSFPCQSLLLFQVRFFFKNSLIPIKHITMACIVYRRPECMVK